ncbi:poly(ethylene terephthalate) hydrolase family protein [Nocardia sp. CDC160]|uniref:poly(ethylene terephthalate) hydrolase family protein n=1 Tax=Nocardia sp. CDC160 TaxID=3112166 RepID=UPI002DB5EF77|nr:hypothetical protein [Nocardia sp. CDC160]MEC3919985.1 hypothetical protein [Nocardia sp. CDC160]
MGGRGLLRVALTVGLALGALVSPVAAAQPPDASPRSGVHTDGPSSPGPFEVEVGTIPFFSDPGFRGGTVWYPKRPPDKGNGPRDTRFPTILVMPGFLSFEGSTVWFGPRLASYGFFVVTLASNWPWDSPVARSDQLGKALGYLIRSKDFQGMIDTERVGLVGWSYGGGAVLHAALGLETGPTTGSKAGPTVQPTGIVALAPPSSGTMASHNSTTLAKVTTPTLTIGIENDFLCLFDDHQDHGRCALPTYNALGASDKMFVQLPGTQLNHFEVMFPNPVVSAYTVAWLGHFVAKTADFDAFLCQSPPVWITGFDARIPDVPCATTSHADR